jgi:arylsulfatase A-like enzyme
MQMNRNTRRDFLKLAGCGLSCLPFNLPLLAAEEKRPPNVVFILVDDLGWMDLGCYGSSFYETPHLDRLAAAGMRFTDAYTSCPVCSPTRASIMTGKYPARLNITDWIPGDDPKNRKLLGPQDLHQLPLEETTIAETLKTHGYKTFLAGKWHLGGEGFYPEDQGFDVNKGGHEKGSPPGGYYSPYKNPKLEDGPEGEYLTDRLTDESIRFLEENRSHPFLLVLAFYTVHTPIQASKKHIEKFKSKADHLPPLNGPVEIPEHGGLTKQRQDNPDYASMVHAMDENVGRLMQKLDDLHLTNNTIVIFTSDNGGLSTRQKSGYPTSNLPLRAGKGWCYEGGIRAPLIVRAPELTQAGSLCHTPVISTDFYPTILELTGLPLMPDQHYDGISLVPLLHGESNLNREALYWHYPHYHTSAWTPGAAVRAGDWKLIKFYDLEKTELYNLKEDLGERNDLSQSLPEKTDELSDMLRSWQKEIGAQSPIPNREYTNQ